MPPDLNGIPVSRYNMRTLETSLHPLEPEATGVASSGTEIGAAVEKPYDAKLEGWEEIADGTFTDNPKFRGEDLLKDMPKVPPKSYTYDLSTPIGARDAMIDNCRALKEKYIDRAGIEGAIAKGREALSKMPEGPAKAKLAKELEALAAEGRKIIAEREHLTRFLPTAPRKVANLNASDKDIAAMAKRDMKDASVALRNFEYDLNRTHGKYGKITKFTNYLSETFTTTRNGFFRAIQNKVSDLKAKITGRKGLDEMQLMKLEKDRNQKLTSLEIHEADMHFDKFAQKIFAFSRAVGVFVGANSERIDEIVGTPSETRTESALKDYGTFKEVLGAKIGGSPDYSYGIEDTLTQLFRQMASGGGESEKLFVLDLRAGVATPVPVGANASFSGKYEYAFKVITNGAGQVSVERCHAGGAEAEVGVGVGKTKVNATLDVHGGAGTRQKYVSPETAARELASGKMGALHSFFINGTGAGVKSVAKLIQTSVSKKPPLNEGQYVVRAKNRGLLQQTDTVNFRGQNSSYVEDTKFVRVGGGVNVSAKIEAIVKANAEAGVSIQSDINAERTQHRSYYNYFTADRRGEAGATYLKLADERGTIDDPPRMRELLARQPTTEAEKKQLARDILDELKSMQKRENAYALDLLERDADKLPPAETVCAACRLGTTALVALRDKLEGLGLGPDGGLGPEFSNVSDDLRDKLQCPRGMRMTKSELLEGLYVDRTYAESNVSFKFHVGAGVDSVSDGFQKLAGMTDSKAAQFGIGATGGALSSLVGAPSAEADVTVDMPKGTDARPYRNTDRMTVDISFKGDLTGKAIVALIQDKFRAAAGKAQLPLKEQNFSAKSILKGMLKPALSGGKGALSASDVDAMSDEEVEEKILSTFSKSQKSNAVFASFKIVDGRLESVGIGTTLKEAKTYGAQIAPVVVSATLVNSTKLVTDTIHATPSFDSLVAKCEDYRLIGHGVEWDKFAMDNSHAFLRMARIAGGVPPKDDANAADDLKRLDDTLESMRTDVEQCSHPGQRDRLMANFNRFMSAWVALRDHYARPDADASANTQKVVSQMCAVLEAVTDHYNILESVGGHSGAIAIDELKNLGETRHAFDGAFDDVVEFGWK